MEEGGTVQDRLRGQWAWLIAGAEGMGPARARPGLPKAEAWRWRRPAAPRSAAVLIQYGLIRQRS